MEMLVRSSAEPSPHAAWWKGATIYQIYPRSYADSNGDGIGDLPGITANLEHIADLGVDAIWISPFYKSPMADFGYDVSDFCDVDPIFGTLDDFDALMARAHALGLKVIIDQVYSHASDQHEWFQASRLSRDNDKADWFVWADAKPDGSPPNNWQSVFGGPAWTWDARRGQYYLHNFLPQQPDLNVHNPAVQDAILATQKFWLDRGVDGIRLDAVNFMMHDLNMRDNPPVRDASIKKTRPFDFQHHFYNQSHPAIIDFLERMRQQADTYSNRFLVAEVGGERGQEEMKQYTAPPGRLHSAYGFLYLYADALNVDLIRQATKLWPEDDQTGWPSWTFSNHDAPRAISRWASEDHQRAFARLSLLLLNSLRGNAFIYQGEELGLPQAHVPFDRLQDPEAITNWPETLGRDGARTPMPWQHDQQHAGFTSGDPWLPVDDRHLDLAVDLQNADETSTLAVARRILALRRENRTLREGGMRFFGETNENLAIFQRGTGNDALLCAFNLSDETVEWQLPAGWTTIESVNLRDAATDTLPAYAGLIAARS